jgi:hypothetical protein
MRHPLRTFAAAAFAAALALPGVAQDTAVPKKYQSLYHALDAELARFARALPAVPAGREVRRAALLTSMRCDSGAELLSSARWDAAMLELDAFQRAGTHVVVLPVCYPLLTPAFQDPRPLLEQLANLANQVRLREMGLLVDHRVMPAGSAPMQATRYYQRMGRERFFKERGEEVKALAIALQPDYLTLISDPQAPVAGMKFSARDWRAHVRRLASQLPRELGDFAPALGAGVALWGDPAFVDAFAAVPGLAYIDLRFYPLAAGGQTMLERVLAWPDRIRMIDPSKRIVLSQVWLSKATDREPASGTADVVARQAFGFWAPLDAKFLQSMAHAARAKDIELVGVAQPRHLFAYLDFFDPATFRANARLLDELATRRAEAAMQRGELTVTGLAYGAL